MDERLHDALDGELPRDDLTAEERARLAAFDARVEALRTSLDARAPDVAPAVMRRIRELALEPVPVAAQAGPLRRLLAALWSPREVRLHWRPAYGLAAVAAVLLMLLGPLFRTIAAPDGTPATAASGEPSIYVQFRLQAGDANTVALAGSFTDWRPSYELRESAPGVWTVLLPLPPGVHDYAFLVDGDRWVADPLAPQVDDGFGGMNSRLALLEPANGR